MNEFIPLSISFPQFLADYSSLNSKWQGEITFATQKTKLAIKIKWTRVRYRYLCSGDLQVYLGVKNKNMDELIRLQYNLISI
jgi:hypothetical protein